MTLKYLNLFLPFFGALIGSYTSIYVSSMNSEVEIYKQEAPEKRMLYNQLSDQITLMKNSGIGLIMSAALFDQSEESTKTINQLSKDCESAKAQVENIYFKLFAFSEKSFDPAPLLVFDDACTPHAIEHKSPIDLLGKYSRKNEESSRLFIGYLQDLFFRA